MSASTEKYDRGLKFQDYRTIESLKGVIFISQDRRLVELFVRGQNEEWRLIEARESGGRIAIDFLAFDLQIDEVYRGVEF